MTDAKDLATKWNVRHRYAAEQSAKAPQAAEVLVRNTDYLPSEGIALDFAAGRGGNALLLHEKGMRTHAWDLSSEAMAELQARLPEATCEVRDVVTQPPAAESFDVIVVSRFLDRSLCPYLAAALRPKGVLFYQTFTKGLSNPEFLLQPNELLTLFPTLRVQWYCEPIAGKEAMLVASRAAV